MTLGEKIDEAERHFEQEFTDLHGRLNELQDMIAVLLCLDRAGADFWVKALSAEQRVNLATRLCENTSYEVRPR